MERALDIVALRSLVGVADYGGMRWFAAPGWRPPERGGWPLVAVEELRAASWPRVE